MNASPDNPFNPTPRMLRQFSALWIVFFLAIAARLYLQGRPLVFPLAIAFLAITLGPLGVIWPRVMRPVFVGWMTLAYPIGWVVSRIVLGFIFFGLFTPIAWVFRLTGRDALGLKRHSSAPSYWQPKSPAADKSQYLRQF